jgi:hypothetical protein
MQRYVEEKGEEMAGHFQATKDKLASSSAFQATVFGNF